MSEQKLKNMKPGTFGIISGCLAPKRSEVYRLLEMGLCRGARFKVLRKSSVFGAIELALSGSRLCIANDLAAEFLVSSQAR